MTWAPQSASWRTQVGPDRTWVRSRTVKRSSAREARGVGIFCTCRGDFRDVYLIPAGGAGRPDIPRSCGCCLPRNGTRHRVFLRRQGPFSTVNTMAKVHPPRDLQRRQPALRQSDGVETELQALHRERLLQAVKPPLTAGLMPQALRPHGEWVASRLNIFSAAYNTNLVKKDEVPKSYEDLKHPRWKGRLAVEADDGDWFGTIVSKMGRDQGVALFRDIVRSNGMQVRKGHTLLSNLVVAGEIPLALTTYSYKPQPQQREGAPIEPLYLAPAVALGYGPAVAKSSPHPH